MMIEETDLEFLTRRRVEELRAALAAAGREAAAAHRMLADLYLAAMRRHGASPDARAIAG